LRFEGQKDYFWGKKGRKGLKWVKTIAHLVLKLVWGSWRENRWKFWGAKKSHFFGSGLEVPLLRFWRFLDP